LISSTTSEEVNPKHSENSKSRMLSSTISLQPEKKLDNEDLLIPVNEA